MKKTREYCASCQIRIGEQEDRVTIGVRSYHERCHEALRKAGRRQRSFLCPACGETHVEPARG